MQKHVNLSTILAVNINKDVQRLSFEEGGENLNVELQANGRRKILALYGMTHNLLTFCNGSD